MEIFKYYKTITRTMGRRINGDGLEGKIASSLEEALNKANREKGSCNIYGVVDEDVNPYFMILDDAIYRIQDEEVGLRTYADWEKITKEKFLQWLGEQSTLIKEKVHKNLRTYLASEKMETLKRSSTYAFDM